MGVVAEANIKLEHVDQVLQDGGNLNERDRGHGVVGNLHGNQVVHPPSNIKVTFLPFMEIHLKMVEQMSMLCRTKWTLQAIVWV